MANSSHPAGINEINKGLVVTEMSLAGLIAIFGIGGNLLTIRVLRTCSLRKVSTAFYFTALAAVDILVLLLAPTTKALSAAVYNDDRLFRDEHVVACKLQLFLNYSMSQISAWILVAVTIDRTVWVLLPFRARQFCTVRRAALVALLIAMLIAGINSQHLWYSSMRRLNDSTLRCTTSAFIKRVYIRYVDPALVTILPFLVMIIANLLIIRKLRQIKAKRQRNLHKAGREVGANLTKMLLSTSIFYLVSSLPYLVLNMLLTKYRAQVLSSKVVANTVYFVQICAYSLFNLNYAIHFLLYCLAGPAFKAEAFRVLRIRQRPAREEAARSPEPATVENGDTEQTAAKAGEPKEEEALELLEEAKAERR